MLLTILKCSSEEYAFVLVNKELAIQGHIGKNNEGTDITDWIEGAKKLCLKEEVHEIESSKCKAILSGRLKVEEVLYKLENKYGICTEYPTRKNWDSTIELLEPTWTFKVKGSTFCQYCGEKALPIRKGLSAPNSFRPSRSIIGYTCDCEGAKEEVILLRKITVLNELHEEKVCDMLSDLSKRFPYDKSLQIKKEISYLECSLKKNTCSFDDTKFSEYVMNK